MCKLNTTTSISSLIKNPVYMEQVYQARSQYHNWRYGQTVYNVLYDMFPDLANEIRATNADPFYDETNLDRFFEFLANKGVI